MFFPFPPLLLMLFFWPGHPEQGAVLGGFVLSSFQVQLSPGRARLQGQHLCFLLRAPPTPQPPKPCNSREEDGGGPRELSCGGFPGSRKDKSSELEAQVGLEEFIPCASSPTVSPECLASIYSLKGVTLHWGSVFLALCMCSDSESVSSSI